MKLSGYIHKNREWASDKLSLDKDYFSKLSQAQSPNILYIGCSDSRVNIEQMLGAEPGDIFVHRNVANIIPDGDESSKAVIEFAVGVLGVEHIIICGHAQCGGVLAAMDDQDLGELNHWIANIRKIRNKNADELNTLTLEADRYKRLIELNILAQIPQLLKFQVVKEAVDRGRLEIHSWFFDMHTGLIEEVK